MRRYGFAVLTTAAAVLLLRWLSPLIHPIVGAPLLAAVVASAVFGGTAPGLVSAALGLAALNYWSFPPFGSFGFGSPEELVRQTVFILTAVLVAMVGGMARRGRLQAEAQVQQSEQLRRAAEAAATESQESATALQRSEERLRLTQAAAGMGLWDWEIASGRTSCTPEYFPLYGLPPDSPPPSYEFWHDRLLHPDDRERVLREVEAALAGQRPYDTEFRVVWPDRTVRWLAGRGEVVRDVTGRPAHMLGVNFDVTARRTMEDRLYQIERLESVGRLAGGVAHEANNQMGIVLGAADFILRRPDISDHVRADAVLIRNAAERTATITAQLLAFGRMQTYRPQVVDLNAIVRSFEPIMARTLGEKAAVTLRLSTDLGLVKADQDQLQQVLLNLCLNARDAMRHPGTFTVETKNLELDHTNSVEYGVDVQPGRYVALVMSDTGHGMDQRTLDRAFEPFFTTKEIGQGTGLGLSTVYGIVKQNRGYIFAESAVGKGTTIKVFLPMASE